jgi:hypothetical protein
MTGCGALEIILRELAATIPAVRTRLKTVNEIAHAREQQRGSDHTLSPIGHFFTGGVADPNAISHFRGGLQRSVILCPFTSVNLIH